ncbi:hypothetical protein ACW9UR_16035 [Halovulum sp. GXIMD14794]
MTWTEDQRPALYALLDRIIPPNTKKGIPGAGTFETADYLARAAAEDRALKGAVISLLKLLGASAADITVDRVRDLEAEAPEAFGALVRAVYMGYYSRPEIRGLVGLAAHPVHPKGYTVAGESADELDALTAPVRARGKVYRDPTGEAARNGE